MTTPDRVSVTVDIYGTSYKIVGSSAEYMKQVAKRVDGQMRSIAKAYPHLDIPRLAVLAAVRMAEDSVKAEEFQEQLNVVKREKADLVQEMNVAQALHAKQDHMYKSLQDDLHRSMGDNKLLTDQLLHKDNLIKERNVEADKLSGRIQELERQLNEQRSSNSQLQAKLKKTEQEVRADKEERSKLQRRLQASVQSEAGLQTSEQRLKEANDKLQRQCNELQKQLAEARRKFEQEIQQANQSVEEQRVAVDQLAQLTDRYEIVSHEYRLLQVEREVEREKVQKLEEEHRLLQEDYSKLQTEYNEWIQLMEQN